MLGVSPPTRLRVTIGFEKRKGMDTLAASPPTGAPRTQLRALGVVGFLFPPAWEHWQAVRRDRPKWRDLTQVSYGVSLFP
jgi:hypothetical protein